MKKAPSTLDSSIHTATSRSTSGAGSRFSTALRGAVAALGLFGGGCNIPAHCLEKPPVEIKADTFVQSGRVLSVTVESSDPGDLCRPYLTPLFHARLMAACTVVESDPDPSCRTRHPSQQPAAGCPVPKIGEKDFYVGSKRQLPLQGSETLTGVTPEECLGLLSVWAEYESANGEVLNTQSINTSQAQPQPRQ